VAERIVHQLIDDIDGTEITEGAGERIEFAVRGVSYQIDLSPTNIAKFDKALKPFVDSAARVRGTRSRSPRAAGNGKVAPQHLAAIRDWARKNGYAVAARGRIKAEVVEAFEAVH
jgi:hypothetical protein